MASTKSTTLRIREMILQGELKPGERVKEQMVAERLGISRTPIRAALPALAKEGLLIVVGARGYAVRRFSQAECLDALHTRAALEGLAARSMAMRVDRDLHPLRTILQTGDELLKTSAGLELDELEALYGEMNASFHTAVVSASDMPILRDLLDRCNIVPFVSPAHVAFERRSEEERRRILDFAHRQHHSIVDAIAAGDAARAEALFREHAYNQEDSITGKGEH